MASTCTRPDFRVQGAGFRIQDVGPGVAAAGYRVQDAGSGAAAALEPLHGCYGKCSERVPCMLVAVAVPVHAGCQLVLALLCRARPSWDRRCWEQTCWEQICTKTLTAGIVPLTGVALHTTRYTPLPCTRLALQEQPGSLNMSMLAPCSECTCATWAHLWRLLSCRHAVQQCETEGAWISAPGDRHRLRHPRLKGQLPSRANGPGHPERKKKPKKKARLA